MGLASWLGFRPPVLPPVHITSAPIIDFVIDDIKGQSVERLWREQPHLRTVVGFAARNIAQLGLHVYRFQGDGGRERQRETPLARLLSKPNADQTMFELIFALVSDLALYDCAYWYVAPDAKSESGWVIRSIPPRWIVSTYDATAFAYGGYKIAFPEGKGEAIKVPASDMLVFHGWSPLDPRTGTSPVEALKSILAEQVHAQIYRDQIWKRGGRVGTYISRPADAPPWDGTQRDRFLKAYAAAYSGDDASKGGGNPLLEDGMKLERVGFSAKDDQYIEANKLSLATVASVYYINPTMVGLLDNANYSNVREFRRMLYGDTLGPTLTMLQDRINSFLVPRITTGADDYVEFNIDAKLQGSFEEQAAVMQSAVGGPWMTRNEARAKNNMTAIEGGDALIVPLNLGTPGEQTDTPATEGEPSQPDSTLPPTEPVTEEDDEDEN